MATPHKRHRQKQDDDNGDNDEATSTYDSRLVLAEAKALCHGLSALVGSTIASGAGSSLQESSSSATTTTTTNFLQDAASRLLQLKALQGRIFERARTSQMVLEQQVIAHDRYLLLLDNLKCQEALNLQSIELSTLPNEQGEGDDDGGSKFVQLAKAIATDTPEGHHHDDFDFLDSSSSTNSRDPHQRAKTIAALNAEFSSRKKLEHLLRQQQSELTTLQNSLAVKQKLLRELPQRLNDVEKASLPLQHLFGGPQFHPTTTLLGSDRSRRLDMAKNLPSKALYTLFYQLQSCLDVMQTAGGDPEEGLPIVEVAADNNDNNTTTTATTAAGTAASLSSESTPTSSVVLKIPIPNVSSATSGSGIITFKPKKTVSISFEYDFDSDVILTSCSKEYGMSHLVGELFPGDHGEGMMAVSNNTKIGGTGGNSAVREKRVYQWCNYLAGLHFPPEEQMPSKKRLSAQVIVRALMRRVRASATLHWIATNLTRHPDPLPIIHPALTLRFNDRYHVSDNAKLSSWTKSPESRPRLVVYEACLKHRSETIHLRATIDAARYPSVPPRWSVASKAGRNQQDVLESLDHQQDNDSPLYNAELNKLLRDANNQAAELVLPDDETTYDWILPHQLAFLMHGWDALVGAASS